MKFKSALVAVSALVIAGASIAPASAHVSVIPGVSAAGNTTDAVTVGKNNTLSFRVGHGCSLEADVLHPTTKKVIAAVDTFKGATSVFSVTVPASALGDAGTTAARPAYVPGWKTAIKLNADKTQTVTWTAINRDFALPNGPEGDVATSQYFDFGLRVAFAKTAAGTTVTFPARQTCYVDVAAVKATKKAKAVKATTIAVYETWDGSATDEIKDNDKHSTAPSIAVNK
ncbi:MAG: hypothetical protein RL036_1039 [Actinomycetota bacterium]